MEISENIISEMPLFATKTASLQSSRHRCIEMISPKSRVVSAKMQCCLVPHVRQGSSTNSWPGMVVSGSPKRW